jgi:glycosyltransferase involved in cell wall biosynthesis
VRVWVITVGEPLPLPGASARPWRTGLLCRELELRGHEVVWWTSTVNHFNKTFHQTTSGEVRVASSVTLQFLHGRIYQSNISLARLRNHREIAAEFVRLAVTVARPDVIVCSFPTIELSDAACEYGCSHGVPVLLDVRDLWPDEIAVRVPRVLRWLVPLVLQGMYSATQRAFQRAAGVIGISQSYLTWGLNKATRGVGPLDAVIPHGYPDPLAGSATPVDLLQKPLPPRVDSAKKIFWFVGTFVGSIDLATVIAAARLLRHRDDIQFVFTGSGQRDAEWRQSATGLSNVVFTGWADREGIAALASAAYAGVAAYKRGALMSLTNKIFEYLGFGLPVVGSLPGEARELLEQAGAGVYYEAGDPRSLAKVVEDLADDAASRARMSSAARTVYLQKFSADAVYTDYANRVELAALQAAPACN